MSTEVTKKYPVGYCAGVYDFCHIGHAIFITKCKQICEKLIVAVHTDDYVMKYKCKPFNDEKVRMKAIEELGIADHVELVYTQHADLFQKYKVTHMFHGDDWNPEGYKRDYLQKICGIDLNQFGVELVITKYTKEISSTALRHANSTSTRLAAQILEGISLIILDLDGTCYVGNRPIPGAKEFIDKIRKRGIKLCLVSNNSSKTAADYVKKLAAMGITISEQEILLSTHLVIDYLKGEKVTDIYLLAPSNVHETFISNGINPSSTNPAFVVLCYDTEVTYQKLQQAAVYMNKGVPLLATHLDYNCPTPEGPIPDCGALTHLLTSTTGQPVKHVFGKPTASMVLGVMKRHDITSPVNVLVIGDRMATDIKMGAELGCRTMLVLSGEPILSQCEKGPIVNADIIVKSVETVETTLN